MNSLKRRTNRSSAKREHAARLSYGVTLEVPVLLSEPARLIGPEEHVCSQDVGKVNGASRTQRRSSIFPPGLTEMSSYSFGFSH